MFSEHIHVYVLETYHIHMEGTQPVEYPAIARAQRLAARRLGGGSSKVKGRHVLDNSAFAESNEEQRSFPEVRVRRKVCTQQYSTQ